MNIQPQTMRCNKNEAKKGDGPVRVGVVGGANNVMVGDLKDASLDHSGGVRMALERAAMRSATYTLGADHS